MWEGGTSIRRKKKVLAFTFFYFLFWRNFEKQIIELSKCFVQFLVLSIIQFFNCAKLVHADWSLFSVRITNALRKNYVVNMVNLQAHKHVSQKKCFWCDSQVLQWKFVPKFQGRRSILSVVTGCGNLTSICYREIFDILQEDRIFRQES